MKIYLIDFSHQGKSIYNLETKKALFVVVVEDDKRLGIYDPRFYRNGESFLFQYI
ncbi:hypothetical protein SAMN05446037_100999 [Anaerovirgula multivorans]|uniref:Uncharacterized protein n=1 Tax=Anaerovirgula multivorans TaxID=312168 RepID=A0A239E6H2_9FIRM|nr:hypothetical protein [Anaerovirgula multivorans]SNS40315.1 hypothetical protein SAMN05446037_100999 [Anaerovirgula multivorans]